MPEIYFNKEQQEYLMLVIIDGLYKLQSHAEIYQEVIKDKPYDKMPFTTFLNYVRKSKNVVYGKIREYTFTPTMIADYMLSSYKQDKEFYDSFAQDEGMDESIRLKARELRQKITLEIGKVLNIIPDAVEKQNELQPIHGKKNNKLQSDSIGQLTQPSETTSG